MGTSLYGSWGPDRYWGDGGLVGALLRGPRSGSLRVPKGAGDESATERPVRVQLEQMGDLVDQNPLGPGAGAVHVVSFWRLLGETPCGVSPSEVIPDCWSSLAPESLRGGEVPLTNGSPS